MQEPRLGFYVGLVPHMAEPTLINVAPSSIATSKSFVIPIESPSQLLTPPIFILFILFWFLFTKGLTVVREAPDLFSMFLSFGILISVMIYFLVNAAYVVGFAPTTGLPMPFISYGGSHIIFTFISMGILLNIARKGRSVTNSYYRGFSYE